MARHGRRPRLEAVATRPRALAGCQPVYLSPTGSDTGTCTSKQPCRTFARAYKVAQEQKRNLVSVRKGSYPKQTVPGGSTAVTFKGEPGTKLRARSRTAGSET